MRKVLGFVNKDVVLTVSMLLAAVSCLLVPPNGGYLAYLDTHTLILLFCLMLLLAGLREQQLFQLLGSRMLGRVHSKRGLALTLVFLCFVSSMFITNDVALITFVPFGLMLLEMAEMGGLLCYVVTMMTLAGNLGSMFTPIGNPQNLYLFSRSGMALEDFLWLMLPYTAAAGVLLFLFTAAGCRRQSSLQIRLEAAQLGDRRTVALYLLLFLLCIGATLGWVPHLLLFLLVTLCVALKDRRLFARVDYSLLATFVFFFIFTGNIKQLGPFNALLQGVLAGRERLVGVLLSQLISNVPAAMLLAGYTDNLRELIVGTNLGGLGTLIASMASLISYKQIAARYPERKRQYLGIFTLCNLGFLLLLYLL